MYLSDLLQGQGAETLRAGDPLIGGVRCDSREVAPGDLFVALVGAKSDGHDYLEQAARRGAAALLVERRVKPVPALPCARVDDTRACLAEVALRFFGRPASELTLVGITGTNGKTSTSYLVESALRAAGRRPGLIGTVEKRYGDTRERAVNTTPESLELQRTLRRMRSSDVDTVVMEVSSHGLALDRVAGCRFQVAAFTNLSQDHLDFHGDMQSYRDAKLLLFSRYLAPGGAAVICMDDAEAPAFVDCARKSGARLLRVSRRDRADVWVRDAELKLEGTRARFVFPSGEVDITLPLPGDFNLENAVVAAGIACALELPESATAAGFAACPQTPGRMERIMGDPDRDPGVLVDYAHTPDALDKLLGALRPLSPGRLFTVFGCGGERDAGKRPQMAAAAARWSDRVIVTSDNPRGEDPEQIIDQVCAGLAPLPQATPETLAQCEHERAWLRSSDRRRAIACAIHSAAPGDTVVIAGKGHEAYQLVGERTLPFDDREEARAALRERRR